MTSKGPLDFGLHGSDSVVSSVRAWRASVLYNDEVAESGADRDIPFTSTKDVFRGGHRRFVIFGAGNIAAKTSRLLPSGSVEYIADNSGLLWGSRELGVEIVDPQRLLAEDPTDRPLVLIATTSFHEVAEQLTGFGYRPGLDFVVSPVLNDLRIITELESIEQRLLFTSGSPPVDSPTHGGGIWEVDLRGDRWTHEKMFSGHCYGIIRREDRWITVDSTRGMLELDLDYNVRRETPLPTGRRGHGVAWSEETGCYYVVSSDSDSVVAFDHDFQVVDTIALSNKIERVGAPAHHCNDCCIVGTSLYVSMFSLTGNWKLDVFDGGVLEFDLTTGEVVGPVMTGLWMPHNVSVHAGSLTVLDSLRGALRTNNNQIVGEFPAFARGLDHDGAHHWIGQSRNRNFSRNLGTSNNISIDAGIIVFDEATKVSRFLQLPPRISEIHAIRLL